MTPSCALEAADPRISVSFNYVDEDLEPTWGEVRPALVEAEAEGVRVRV